jgi:hypothetical protein
MVIINLYINGFLLIFKICFHDIRGRPSHLLRRTVWESLVYVNIYLKVNSPWIHIQTRDRDNINQECRNTAIFGLQQTSLNFITYRHVYINGPVKNKKFSHRQIRYI